jgi:myo-inositol-1(or 4)-monophosphatase
LIDSKARIDVSQATKVAVKAAKEAGNILRTYWKCIYQGANSSYQERYKSDTSIQTTADLEAEQAILQHINTAFPHHSIDTEERGYIPSSGSDYVWIIDPLDGTENFIQGIPYFSSSITLCKGNQPLLAVVYNPITDHLYSATRGQGATLTVHNHKYLLHVSQTTQLEKCRVFFIPDFVTKHQSRTNCIRNMLYAKCRRVLDSWSPALDWCVVASGKADLVVAIAGGPIRSDAGILILQEAGGKVTDFYNNNFSPENTGKLIGSNGNSDFHEALWRLVNDHVTGVSQ